MFATTFSLSVAVCVLRNGQSILETVPTILVVTRTLAWCPQGRRASPLLPSLKRGCGDCREKGALEQQKASDAAKRKLILLLIHECS